MTINITNGTVHRQNDGSGALVEDSGGGSWNPGMPPVISSVSGVFSQGNTITISGSNLSANRHGQLFYDDFTAGTLGNQLIGWTHGSTAPYVYDNNGMRAGARCAYCHMIGGYQFDTAYQFAASDTIYVDHWIRYTMPVTGPDDGSGAPQIKMTRIISGTDPTDGTANPRFGITNLIGSQAMSQAIAEGPSCYLDTGLPPDDSWHRYHAAMKISTLGVRDGWRYVKTDSDIRAKNSGQAPGEHYASLTGSVAESAWSGELMATNNGTDGYSRTGGFQIILLPFFQRQYQESHVRIGPVWVNDTAECVYVSTGPTWSAGGQTAIVQPATSRTNNEWQVTVEEGNLPSTGALYLYARNADGLFNENGVQVRA